MIVLNECRIDSEGKHLIIEASVDNLSYFKDVYIESITIDTDKTYISNGPSSDYVFTQSFKTEQENVGVKNIKLVLDARDLSGVTNFNDNIFFVYIKATGTPAPHTPCGRDNIYTIGVAVNLRPIYNMAMGYIKELDNNCSIPSGLIDMILRLKAFDLSLRTGSFTMAIKQWDRLFKNKKTVPSKKGCGCNG